MGACFVAGSSSPEALGEFAVKAAEETSSWLKLVGKIPWL